jgi:hypothetical protein
MKPYGNFFVFSLIDDEKVELILLDIVHDNMEQLNIGEGEINGTTTNCRIKSAFQDYW